MFEGRRIFEGEGAEWDGETTPYILHYRYGKEFYVEYAPTHHHPVIIIQPTDENPTETGLYISNRMTQNF